MSSTSVDAPRLAGSSPRADRGHGALYRLYVLASSALAAVLGLAPHVLHHVGPLAGAAIFAGTGGSLLFGAIGMAASIPLLVRVHRRCGSWRVPAALLVTFAVVFSISTFVIGPAISGSDAETSSKAAPTVTAPAEPSGHKRHH